MPGRNSAPPGTVVAVEPAASEPVRRSKMAGAAAHPVRSKTIAARTGNAFRPMAPCQPELHGPEWELVQRIAASPGFRRSPRLANFLLFVCRRALTGESATINEQQIGVHVFDRSEQFNRSDDNIVRNYARMLRKRIDEYFLREGSNESLRLHVPRGGYVPAFAEKVTEVNEAQDEATALVQEPLREAQTPLTVDPPPTRRSRIWPGALIVLLGAALGFALARLSPASWFHRETVATRLSREFWQTVFVNDRDTFIVPSDGGLVILHRFLEQPTTLREYISGAYRRPEVIAQGLRELTETTPVSELSVLSHKVETLGDRRYTSIVDLDLTSRLSRQREVVPERLLIRYARELRMDDLKSSNAILIGSIDANPWVELFQPQLNFQFTYGGTFGGSSTILNRHPLPGERNSYASVTGDPAQKTYGVIASVPNLGGTGHVLLIEGINMAGTQAAGEFLLNPANMQKVLQRAEKSNGEMRSFEILLETSNIAANSSQSTVLSERIGQP